jgi:ABC-type Na+ efflux pump permease subunit
VQFALCANNGSLAGRIEDVNTILALSTVTIQLQMWAIEVNAQELKAELLKVLLICGWGIN